MDWRKLVLILSLVANGYLLTSVRNLDFQARELTQSATRHRKDLAAITTQMVQAGGSQSSPIRNLVTEAELDRLIRTMASAEAEILAAADCGPKVVRNTQKVRALQGRLKNFIARYEDAVKKVSANSLEDPRSVQEVANRLKNEVLQECRP